MTGTAAETGSENVNIDIGKESVKARETDTERDTVKEDEKGHFIFECVCVYE